mgnify:CR=1 FL=1
MQVKRRLAYFIHDNNAQQGKALSLHHYYRITPLLGFAEQQQEAYALKDR